MKHLLNTYKILIFQILITFFKFQTKNSNNSKINSNENYQLHFVFEIMRHGARSPMDLTSSSSSSEDELDFFHEKWSDGAGELTSIGIRQHFLIGYRNHLKYIDNNFLKENYDSNEIFLISTPLNRTLMSINAEIHGMFLPGTGPCLDNSTESEIAVPPLVNNESILDEIDFLDDSDSYAAIRDKINVLPVFTFDDEVFNTQYVKVKYCKALEDVYKKRRENEKYEDFFEELKEKYGEQLKKILNKKNTDFIYDYDFMDKLTETAIADYTENKNMTFLKNNFPDFNFRDFVEKFAFKYSYFEFIGNDNDHDEKIAQVSASQTFKYILNWMNNIIQNKEKTPKFVIFAMHETNLGPFTHFLKLALEINYPENFVNYANYSANVHLELFSENNIYYVNYLFNDLSIKKVTFEFFEEKITEFIMDKDDIKYFCDKKYKNNYTIVIIILSSIIFIMIVTLIIIYYKKKNIKNNIENISSIGLNEKN